MIGSHFDPELAVFRPARSVTVILMSLAMLTPQMFGKGARRGIPIAAGARVTTVVHSRLTLRADHTHLANRRTPPASAADRHPSGQSPFGMTVTRVCTPFPRRAAAVASQFPA